jgi:hypothetical protein
MINHSVDSVKGSRIKELEAEIASRDYRVIKAARQFLHDQIEEMYPGETAWYDSIVAKINELKAREG